MWSKKWYYEYLKFIESYKIHPVDFFDKIIEMIKEDRGEIGNLYKQFMKDYEEAESFSTFNELYEYWKKPSNFNRLKNGDYGKLNMLYTYQIVLNHRNAFNKFLLNITKKYTKCSALDMDFINKCQEILKFQDTKFIQIDNKLNIKKQLIKTFKYDVLEWKNTGYGILKKLKNKKKYLFYLPAKQQKTLNIQLKQYKSKNINSTLRNMTVYTNSYQFFYDVKTS
jgi:hypothetical protein